MSRQDADSATIGTRAKSFSQRAATFYIETLGCPKNRADSRRMRIALLQHGFREATDPEQADFYLINSCSFIREAQEETIETVFAALKLKERKAPNMKVGLIGCFAERFPEAVRTEIPELDFVLGTQHYHEVGTLLARRFGIPAKHQAETFTASICPDHSKPFAWLHIAQGCSRRCAFCIIPKIRGPFTPHDLSDIERQLAEESSLRGETPLREVILVSQDTISLGVEALERIIAHLSEREDIAWIRLQYLFPDRRVLELLELWPRYPKLVPYLDIPFQHVAPEILRRMRRPTDTAVFEAIIAKARALRPDFEIRTSFIVGFPGETEAHCEQLAEFIRNQRIDKLALFRYSHEPGTTAGDHLSETVPDSEKYHRINWLREQHLEVRKHHALGLIGRRETMLLEEIDGEYVLRRAQDAPESDEIVAAPMVPKGLKPGAMPEVELKAYTEYAFVGEIVVP